MKRVTIPIAGFNRSGGVKTLVLLANAMASRGWRVRIIAPDYTDAPPFALAPGVELLRLSTGAGSRALRMALYYVRLTGAAARDTDVCVANFYLTAYCAWISRLQHRTARVIYFLQGDEAESHGRLADAAPISRWLRFLLARVSYRLPLTMFCVSEWLRAQVRRPDAVVVGQGIDVKVFSPDGRMYAGERPVVGTIASAAKVKGYRDVLAAVSRLRGRPFDLLIVESSAESDLPEGIPARSMAATTEDQMAAFYRACDVFVFASHREGFGLPPLEAMASACAVVTTDCGGVADFARHGENCLMVPPQDPAALADALEQLIADRALRDRLSAAGARTGAMWPREQFLTSFFEQMSRVAP